MTEDEFREIALSMHGAVERAHMGHPDFRAGGRIFCTLLADDRHGTVKLTPEEQREFMRMHPKVFSPASGAWGRQGWTTVRLDAADEATIRGAVIVAWQDVVEKRAGRRTSKPAAKRGARPSRKRQA
jgi:hypothetical protein